MSHRVLIALDELLAPFGSTIRDGAETQAVAVRHGGRAVDADRRRLHAPQECLGVGVVVGDDHLGVVRAVAPDVGDGRVQVSRKIGDVGPVLVHHGQIRRQLLGLDNGINYTSGAEDWVRRYPQHWFWMHRRWKRLGIHGARYKKESAS